MRVLLFFFNILASIGLLLLVSAGFFYGVALLCVPFYATYRAFTEKEPTTKKKIHHYSYCQCHHLLFDRDTFSYDFKGYPKTA